MKFKLSTLVVACALTVGSQLSAHSQDAGLPWKPQITDCAAFFGVWAQSDSSSADTYRLLNTAFVTYAKYVYAPGEPDVDMAKSRRGIGMMLHSVRKGDDKDAVNRQMQTCLSLLKKAEQELWPRLSDVQKASAPRVAAQIIR
jgi:hypothetical protein